MKEWDEQRLLLRNKKRLRRLVAHVKGDKRRVLEGRETETRERKWNASSLDGSSSSEGVEVSVSVDSLVKPLKATRDFYLYSG